MIKEAIVKIVNKGDLSYDEAYAVMNEIMSGETTPTQNAAFLAALSTKSARAETTDEIAGCAAATRDKSVTHCSGLCWMLTPSASRQSAVPHWDEAARLPCLATFMPPAAATRAEVVEMLKRDP